MKKIFIQFGQWISRHRKKLFYGVLALFVFQICLFDIGGIGISSHVFAADAGGTSSQYLLEKVGKWLEEFKFFNVVINVLIYPILIVAGKLVDNSLVYGEIFGFDAVLRKLWVMIRNVANYGLGFLFVYKICEYLIKGQKTADIKKLLISVLVAGIGIQASWFIMSVLIDASTIVTYSVGGLPISVLKQEDKEKNFKNPYIWKTVVSYNAQEPDEIKLYMNTGSVYISRCETFNFGSNPQETLILAPKYIYYEESGHYFDTQSTKCLYDGQVYVFSSLYVARKGDCKDKTGCTSQQSDYQASLENAKKELNGASGDAKNTPKDKVIPLIEQGKILQIGDAHASSGINGNVFQGIFYTSGQHIGLDVDNEWNGKALGLKRLNDVLDGTYAGVFSELYASLLHIGKDVKITRAEAKDGKYVELLNEALALLYAITIAIPLIAMTIVLIGRIGILWMAIPLSPLLVLIKAFGLESKIAKTDNDFLSNFKLENLLPLIFFPAIICFAISLSAVLIKVIISLNWEVVETKELPILSGVIKLDIASFGVALGKTICSIMCIAVTWFLARAAIKTTKLGKSKVVTGLADITRSAIGSLPIVPIPTKQGVTAVGIDAAFGLNGNEGIFGKLDKEVKSTFRESENKAVSQLLGESTGDPESQQLTAYVQKLGENPKNRTTSTITIGNGLSTKTFNFSQMDTPQQKQVIEEINKLSTEIKNNLGLKEDKTALEIETKDHTKYTYNTTTHNFEPVKPAESQGQQGQQGGQGQQAG